MKTQDVTIKPINDWAFYFRDGIKYAYVICGTKNAMVIDMGLNVPDFRDLISPYIGSLEVIPVLTHAHHDHRKNAYQFNGVWVHKDGSAIVGCQGREEYLQLMAERHGQVVHPFPTGYYPLEDIELKVAETCGELKEGMIFSLGNRDVIVYETPGHSPDSVSFLVEGILFAGDIVKPALSQGSIDHYAHFYESNLRDYHLSLCKLMDSSNGIHTICSGHTDPYQGTSVLQPMRIALERILEGKSTKQVVGSPWGLVEKHIYNEISFFTQVTQK